MKKLLVLILVFVMASAANATLQISANGDQDPVETEIFVWPSEVITLDIWTDADITPGGGLEGYFALAAPWADATISGGAAAQADPGLAIYDDAVNVGGVPLPPDDNGVFGTIIVSELPSFPAGSTLFDEILLHCEWSSGDMLVTLYYSPDSAAWNPVDTVLIHQFVPEPATVLLLGFGSLALLRKRRT